MDSIEQTIGREVVALILKGFPYSIWTRMAEDEVFASSFGFGMTRTMTIGGSPKLDESALYAAVREAASTGKAVEISGSPSVIVSVSEDQCQLEYSRDDTRVSVSNPMLLLLHPALDARRDALSTLASTMQLDPLTVLELSEKIEESALSDEDMRFAVESVAVALESVASRVASWLDGTHDTLMIGNVIPDSEVYYSNLCVPVARHKDYDGYVAGEFETKLKRAIQADLVFAIRCAILAPLKSGAPIIAQLKDVEAEARRDAIVKVGIPAGIISRLNLLSVCLEYPDDLILMNHAEQLLGMIEAGIRVPDERQHLCEAIANLGISFMRVLRSLRDTPDFWKCLASWAHAEAVCDAIDAAGFDKAKALQIISKVNVPLQPASAFVALFDVPSSRCHLDGVTSLSSFGLCRLLDLAVSYPNLLNLRGRIGDWFASHLTGNDFANALQVFPGAVPLLMDTNRPCKGWLDMVALGMVNMDVAERNMVAVCQEIDIDKPMKELGLTLETLRIASEIFNVASGCIDRIIRVVDEWSAKSFNKEDQVSIEDIIPSLAGLASNIKHEGLTRNVVSLIEKIVRNPNRNMKLFMLLSIALWTCTGFPTKGEGLDAYAEFLFRLASAASDSDELGSIYVHTEHLETLLPVEHWKYARVRAQCMAGL